LDREENTMNEMVSVFALALAVLVSAPMAHAQKGKVCRIGYLRGAAGPESRDEAFRQGLRDLGWIEGKNIAFESRWAAGKPDRRLALAKELVRLKVDIIVTAAVGVARAAKKATSTIPIVTMWAADVVENGLVASLARPGGNLTGMSEQYTGVNMKLLEVLHETLPKVSRIGFIWHPDSQVYRRTLRAARSIAPAMGVTIQSLEVTKSGGIESALKAAAQERVGALLVMGRAHRFHGREIAAFSLKHRVPVSSILAASVKKFSSLLAYAPDWNAMAREAAMHVNLIFKGAKPAEIPVGRPKKFDLIVNLKAAKALGITIPPEVLFRATKVIK
jgi:putative ABC transport system substrate-binding protein